MYTHGRREEWKASKHGSQHASTALAIDVGLQVSTKAPWGLAVFVQMDELAWPLEASVSVCTRTPLHA